MNLVEYDSLVDELAEGRSDLAYDEVVNLFKKAPELPDHYPSQLRSSECSWFLFTSRLAKVGVILWSNYRKWKAPK